MPLATESIPISKENHRSDHANDFVSTPDGAMYSTTPGGTRIIYDRLFLLRCRDSPLAKTPPPNLPDIPGITTPNRPPNQQIRQKITENPGEHIKGPEMSPNQRYEAPHFFQFPQVYDVNSNNMPNVHSRFVRPTFGGPLAQYRQRQTVQANPSPHLMFQPRFNLPPGPQIGAEHCGMFSPVPVDHSSQFGLPIPFMHPMQGPAAPVFDHQPKMSQLAVWRRTHARPGDPAAMGYTTAKAPQLRSSFEQDAEHFHPGPGIRRLSSGYGSQHDSSREQSSLVMTIPDDPSIIAYKPSHLKA